MPHTPDITLAYVGGGSLNWAQVLMGDLAQDGAIAGEVRLYDIDQAAAARNAALGNRLSQARGQSLRYAAPATLAEALDCADFVVVSILPGSFEDMVHDIDLPAAAGVLQSVGDTVGPGGFLRAMRAIPEMAAIAQAIGVHCPRAFVCNLTNPMSALTGAMYAALPGIRAWGSCHEVVKLRHIVAWLANRRAGAIRHGFRDVEVHVLGINHFTFVDRAVVDGRDLLPDYLAFAAELDGLYMGLPFQVELGQALGEPERVADALRQFETALRLTWREKTGLYVHGVDEGRLQAWADPVTGQSPALGWLVMAMVDVLELVGPEASPELTARTCSLLERIVALRWPSGLWL